MQGTMRLRALIVLVTVAATATAFLQSRDVAAQQPSAGSWPLHSGNLQSTRYSPLTNITSANAAQLTTAWSAQPGGGFASQTPLVVDGVMFLNAGSKLYALNAATGESMWTFEAATAFPGGGRGPAYGDGRVYAFGATAIYAVDAKTGKAVESFGEKGMLRIVNKALDFKYPGKYAADFDPTTLGYSMTTPPTYWNGTLYVGVPFADSVLPGGFLIAADGATGAVKWVFTPVPQTPADEGWELAKDTWRDGSRYGGGIWTQPSMNPALGLIYFNASNPSPNYDGSARKGINLFTNSVIALHLATGKMAWYYQTLHHDIWDWDLVAGPLLFDIRSGNRTVKGVAAFGKTCYGYFLDRETGKPLQPIVETPVPTKTDVPGEEPWPTQPIPQAAGGVRQEPFCMTLPTVTDPELAGRVRPSFHPYQANEFIISSPGNQGGANYGPPAFSPKHNLVYITGKNDAYSMKVKPVGDTLKPGRGNMGHFAVTAETGKSGVTPTQTLAAYNPLTGRQAWHTEMPGVTGTGSLATAGDVVFQAVGAVLYGFDAKSGAPVFKTTLRNSVRASPMTYAVNGRQFVAIVASNTVVAFALPESR